MFWNILTSKKELLKFYIEQLKSTENDKSHADYFFERGDLYKDEKNNQTYINNNSKSMDHLYWTTSKTTSQILIA